MQKYRHVAKQLTNAFWFIPATLVVFSVALAAVLIWVEQNFAEPSWLMFIYNGGESGARSLLGAVASASIGVAGTIFSITIAALSSVVSTMGPRLLHGFLADRGIQTTLGIFVATFAFSLFSLRAVSGGTNGEDVFVPHYNVTVAMLYAAACIGFLVYYIAHMARSISMTRVVNLLARDLDEALDEGTELADEQQGLSRAPQGYFVGSAAVRAPAGGYVQAIDYEAIARYAAKHEKAVDIVVRPGDHVLTGSVVARVKGAPQAGQEDDSATTQAARALRSGVRGDERIITKNGADGAAIMGSMIIGAARDDSQDLEFSVRQLLEVGVRALSPGTNDPFTAMDVIDRFAEALARLRNRALPIGVIAVDDALRVQYTVTTFEGLVDVMFHQLRQNAAGTTAVYLRLLEAYARVAAVVDVRERVDYLRHHGELVWADAQRLVDSAADVADIRARYEQLCEVTAPEGGADTAYPNARRQAQG